MDFSWAVPIIISIVGAVSGAYYAKKQGLPDLKREVETQTGALVLALKEQLTLANTELSLLRPKLAAAETRVEHLEDEVARLEARIVKLYLKIAETEKRT